MSREFGRMTKRIPIAAAKRIADDYDMDQVVLVTFSKSTGRTHVVTYGKTVEECRQAAMGGNMVKKALGWPDELCHEKEKVREEPMCPECGHRHKGARPPCSWVYGRRGWRQLGVYDG
jgi:hypothetical protein